MIGELRRSLDFFISQPDGMAVDTLVLSGGQALLPGMDTYIEEKLTIPVTVMREPGENNALRWPEPATAMTPFVPALGLALQGVGLSNIDVDFLPQDRKITRDFPYKTVGVMAALLVAILAISAQAGKKWSATYRDNVASLQSELSQRSDQDNASMQAQAAHDRVAALYSVFAKGVADRGYWLDFLAEVSAAKPTDVLIDRLSMAKDGTVQIAGVAETQRSAADFNDRLRGVVENPVRPPTLDDVVRDRDPRYEQAIFRFRISFQRSGKIVALPSPTPTPGPVGGARGAAGAGRGAARGGRQ
jgi:hypothetical protein